MHLKFNEKHVTANYDSIHLTIVEGRNNTKDFLFVTLFFTYVNVHDLKRKWKIIYNIKAGTYITDVIYVPD